MRYLALACDYDGTIARDGLVDGPTLAALEGVASSGRRLVLMTGRQLDDLLLSLFLQIGEGLDDRTWQYHLKRGDYGRWFREAVKNEELAQVAERLVRDGTGPAASRGLIRDAIEQHYTLPAPYKPAPSSPARQDAPAISSGSPRARANGTAEGIKHVPRRNSLDPVALLKEDHIKVKGMFQQFENMKEKPDEMKRISHQAIMELQIHSMIEEELFYPALRRGQETEEVLNEAEEEHHVVDLLIAELLKMKPTDKQYAAKFTVLAENTKHHIQEEEGEMLPKARQILGSRYEELGDQMMRRKQELMKEFGGKPRSTTRRPAATGRKTTTRSKATTGTSSRTASGTRASTGTRSRTASVTRAGSSRSTSGSRSKSSSSRGKSGSSSRSRS